MLPPTSAVYHRSRHSTKQRVRTLIALNRIINVDKLTSGVHRVYKPFRPKDEPGISKSAQNLNPMRATKTSHPCRFVSRSFYKHNSFTLAAICRVAYLRLSVGHFPSGIIPWLVRYFDEALKKVVHRGDSLRFRCGSPPHNLTFVRRILDEPKAYTRPVTHRL